MQQKFYHSEDPSPDHFTLFKLNGSCLHAGIPNIIDDFDAKSLPYINELQDIYTHDFLFNVLKSFNTVSKFTDEVFKSGISFAWESDGQKELMENIKATVAETDVLIVIGYSFPLFNRSIDKQILKFMPKVRTVYYQDPNAESLISRIKTLAPWDLQRITPVEDMDQFFIPHQF